MKNSKKDFAKFTKRNVHKRKSKDAARAALLRAVAETGTDISGVKIRDRVDLGRGGRRSAHPHRDEIQTRGIFSSSKSGFGFVALESGERDIFIPEDKTLGAVDGDFVSVIYHSYKNYLGEEKTEGRITKILEIGRRSIIGTVSEEYSRHGRRLVRSFVLIPDDARVMMKPYISELAGARIGDKVEALIKRDGSSYPECTVERIFGDTESKEANYAAILADAGIETEFSRQVLDEAKVAASEPVTDEGRVRFDNDIIFTMDSASAKDLDDAVSLRRLAGGGYRLGVHIADVSHYVKERTALDRCAMSRGTSVYFTDKVVPMLPESLSNGACSLNAGEDKYAISAVIDLDGRGEIVNTKICRSVIRSRLRGVYSEINALLSGEADSDIKKKYKSVLPSLIRMRELYEILDKRATERGYINFEEREAEILLSESGEPVDILRRERGLSERMIEHFMLTANEAVARVLFEREIPCVYRIHEPPSPDKMSEFLIFAKNLGLDISGIDNENIATRRLAELLSSAEEKGLLTPVSYSMLRSMSKAKYSDVRSAHFGLGLSTYCHFTSPIRRLSDLATHRIINNVLLDGKRAQNYTSYARRAATAASEAELRALGAERRIENLYKVISMSEHVGECFDAIVSSVTSFGMFCETANTCEGLVPIREMPGEFFFDEKNLALRSSRCTYKLADRVRVCLEEVDVIRGKMRFSLSEDEE
ncbi:MAG: VacB/RNase II family 3'-5' exoribonuclease [Clostridia bacterium]|nr:VacB/RNase II family 3'-5' exoribonuclease [Clostridia bacterium]